MAYCLEMESEFRCVRSKVWNYTAAASLLLCLVTVALWVGSHFRGAQLPITNGGNWTFVTSVMQDQFQFTFEPMAPARNPVPAEGQGLSGNFAYYPCPLNVDTRGAAHAIVFVSESGAQSELTRHIVFVHFWLITFVFASLPFYWIVRRLMGSSAAASLRFGSSSGIAGSLPSTFASA